VNPVAASYATHYGATTTPSTLDTPQPVCAPESPIVRPQPLASHQQIEALAAMRHAKARYPGAAGEILAREIESYKELGCIGQPSAPVVRLIRELMSQ
jgi:hypothetical protein